MGYTEARPRRPRAHRREYERVSSREATKQSEEISQLQPAQIQRPQSRAIGAIVQRQRATAKVRQRYRCDRFPLPQLPIVGSRRTRELNAFHGRYIATHRAKQTRSTNRRSRTLVSAREWI